MEKSQKSPIQLAQKPPKFFTDKEESFIKGVFSGDEGEKNLKVIRKALLPTYDVNGSIGMAVDLWTGENYATMAPEHQTQAILSRIHFINSVEKTLNMLKSVANRVDETEGQMQERLRKDSTQ